ncbi:MAG: SpoVR family protein [Planctomycetota bacterium]|jgi:stage V sporulation protein R
MPTVLTPELKALQEEIEAHARRHGLDFFPVFFEMLDFDELNEVASYGGFPIRYPHWRFGMTFEQMAKGYEYGLHKIYELVINSDPCYAYLMKANSRVDQKTVMAHVMGHSDFFKNNFWFSATDRKMFNEMANHGTRIRKYIDRYGLVEVENFVDTCLSLDNLIDPFLPFQKPKLFKRRDTSAIDAEEFRVWRIQAKSYMDRFVNPPEFIEAQKQIIKEKKEKRKKKKRAFPTAPAKDILLFLIEHAPLERWERDVLSIIRDEAYYFTPQAQTKIMNEGWAAYWHSRIMTEDILKDSEVVDFADHHSGTLASSPGSLNPYKIGIELFRDIEDRWNKGKFGREYEACDDMAALARWDKKTGAGQSKIFEVRKIYNDITFIDEFLTPEFAHDQKLFVWRFNPQSGQYEIASRDWRLVKAQILFGLTNLGHPYITADDGNFRNRGELYLRHRYDGVDIQLDRAHDTLRNLFRIWQRPVHLETLVENEGKILTFDGEKVSAHDFKAR